MFGLIDGAEMVHLLRAHPEWVTVGEWSQERYVEPVWITETGREALAQRDKYDMEPVVAELVEPGWKAVPTPRSTCQA